MHGRDRAIERMAPTERRAVYAIGAALWLSGGAWILLDQCCARRGPFGVAPHPLEPPLLLGHAVIGILAVYLCGWISARHVLHRWRSRARRLSGGALAALIVALIVSGFALYFLTDEVWQHEAALTHEVLGIGVAVFAIQHWFLSERRGRPIAPRRGAKQGRLRKRAHIPTTGWTASTGADDE